MLKLFSVNLCTSDRSRYYIEPEIFAYGNLQLFDWQRFIYHNVYCSNGLQHLVSPHDLRQTPWHKSVRTLEVACATLPNLPESLSN